MDQPLFLIQEVPLDKQGQSTNKVTFLAHFSPTFAKQNPKDLEAKKTTIEFQEDEELEEEEIKDEIKLDPKTGTVVFLVDQSGSMSGSKMNVTKDAL